MRDGVERNLGSQPIARVMAREGLRPHDLVSASTGQLTHKMVARACRGRRLTPHVQRRVLEALQRASGRAYVLGDLFTYGDCPKK